MRITPLDVRKQEFRKSVRGFDCDEVRAFLSTLADEYEAVLVDNKVLRERVTEQDEKISEYKALERTLRDTLMTAERVMQETKDNATREGDLLIQEAHLKSRTILEECRTRTEELRREMIGLRKEKETYLARFKSLAEAQIQFIETHNDDFADLDQRLIQMADQVVEGHFENSPRIPHADSSKTAPQAGDDADQWRDYSPSSSPKAVATAATVDLAAMGIAVPAVPLEESTVQTEEAESEDVELAT